MREFLDSILDWSGAAEGWRPISRWAIAAWLAFYACFLVYAFKKHGGYLFIDSANLVVHEGGHNLFRWFGPTLCLWGGTILQWLVPLLLAIYFFRERQPAAFVFCSFFFFENWLYTATYMADARAMVLPLVTTGDPEFAEHDWNTIFTSLGVLPYDTRIAAVVSFLGWCGMLCGTAWLALRLRTTKPSVERRASTEQTTPVERRASSPVQPRLQP
ncbi:MAG: hypothetical protein ACLPHI_16380 [Terriglobales bacterium]|jgi:hypothetical protein